jgi:hypothetical protein
MSKSWPFALAVIAVGGLAGVAIAGRPVPSDPFVLDPSVTVFEPTSSTSLAVSTTAISEPATSTAATITVPASTSVAPTTAPSTTAGTTAPTTSAAPTTTEARTTTVIPVIPGPLPRNQVKLVIANGDGRFRLSSITADRMRSLGYVVDLGNAVNPVDATVIYYRPGFDDEAAYAAIDIGLPDAIIFAFPNNASQPITNSDDRGDIIIVLGPDAPR